MARSRPFAEGETRRIRFNVKDYINKMRVWDVELSTG